jgi:hypothetical protein
MTNEYVPKELMNKEIIQTIQGIKHNLERLTIKLNRNFPLVEASKIQEYVEAEKALDKYMEAIQSQMDLLYTEERKLEKYLESEEKIMQNYIGKRKFN